MTEDHYFSADPASSDERFPLRVRLAGLDLELEGAPGVFSGDRLDPGTAVLLDRVFPPPTGNLLDLGCGWGSIALTMGLLSPKASVWAVDVNPRALDLTRRNAESVRALHSLGPMTICLPGEVPPSLTFDALWSNPPIRIGKEALHRLLATWLPRLSPKAQAHLVVHKNLGADSLARWLNKRTTETAGTAGAWGPVERVASSQGYRVLRVRSPGPGS